MSPNGKLAATCFLENIQFLGCPPSDPEKYNLYNGLRVMAEQVEALHLQLHNVQVQLDSIASSLPR